MAKESEKILNDVLKIYEELYKYKDILACNKLFKYDVNKVSNALEQFKEDYKSVAKKSTKKSAKKEKIQLPEFNSNEDIKKFYYENLVYDRNSEKEQKTILNKYDKEQYQIIYEAIYGKKPANSYSKTILLEKIQDNFDNIDRANKI